jgi:hypothetical protein
MEEGVDSEDPPPSFGPSLEAGERMSRRRNAIAFKPTGADTDGEAAECNGGAPVHRPCNGARHGTGRGVLLLGAAPGSRRRAASDGSGSFCCVADDDAGSDCSMDNSASYSQQIEFGSIAIYIPAMQVVATLLLSCSVALVACAMLPFSAVSAVRTASLCSGVSIVAVGRPIRLFPARGVDAVFDTVRPAVAVYVLALVVEQLGHSCAPLDSTPPSPYRAWLYHAMTVVLLCAGFARAARPKRDADYPFIAALGALALMALLPPVARANGGPLCEPPASAAAAVERIFRAVLFGCSYCVMAYADAPACHSINHVGLSAVRATAASVWVLCVVWWLLILVPVHVALALWARLHTDRAGGAHAATLDPSRCVEPDDDERMETGILSFSNRAATPLATTGADPHGRRAAFSDPDARDRNGLGGGSAVSLSPPPRVLAAAVAAAATAAASGAPLLRRPTTIAPKAAIQAGQAAAQGLAGSRFRLHCAHGGAGGAPLPSAASVGHASFEAAVSRVLDDPPPVGVSGTTLSV